MSKSVAGFSDLITADVDVQPTITPVLDLTNIKKGSGQIGSLLSTQPVSVDAAYAKALAISTEKMRQQETDAATAVPVSKSVTYNQYNSSPKALAAAEIYRRSNNQISKLKKDLED
jgi:hypothetical protein